MTEGESFSSKAGLLRAQLEKAKEILVVFSARASLDEAALATTLYLVLKAQKKNPTLLCLGEPLVAHSALVGIDRAETKLPQTGLILNINNSQHQIGNISCDGDFNSAELKIYIKASEGQKAPTAESIRFMPLMANYEKVVVVGRIEARELIEAGIEIKEAEKMTMISREKTVMSSYLMSLPKRGVSSYSALGAMLFRQWVWNVSADMATNLLMGIDEATENLSLAEVRPEIFEMTGWLIRCGGRRYLSEAKKRVAETRGWDLRREDKEDGSADGLEAIKKNRIEKEKKRGDEERIRKGVLVKKEAQLVEQRKIERREKAIEVGGKREENRVAGGFRTIKGEVEEKSAREVAREHEKEERERREREVLARMNRGVGAITEQRMEQSKQIQEVEAGEKKENDQERAGERTDVDEEKTPEDFRKTREIINNRFKRHRAEIQQN